MDLYSYGLLLGLKSPKIALSRLYIARDFVDNFKVYGETVAKLRFLCHSSEIKSPKVALRYRDIRSQSRPIYLK